MPKQPEQQQQGTLSRPPLCFGCRRTMLLVGRESHPDNVTLDLLTFACDCGKYATATTGH